MVYPSRTSLATGQVLLMELMSSGYISKTALAIPGGDYQYLLNALFVFIMQPQLILYGIIAPTGFARVKLLVWIC